MPWKLRIATSAALYAVAFLLTTILHELAHFVVALGLGRSPVLFHNSVVSADASDPARVATSLAGPAFSAMQGLALLPLERRARRLDPTLRLLLAWLCFHGLMNASGYLFTTAFVPDADMGSAARRLGVPLPGLLALTALGFWLIRVASRAIYPGFVALLPSRDTAPERNHGLVRLALLAWPTGVALVLPSSLPVPHWLSLFYVVIAGVGAVWFTEFSKDGASAEGGAPLEERAPPWPWLALAALSALCVLVLRRGVSFLFVALLAGGRGARGARGAGGRGAGGRGAGGRGEREVHKGVRCEGRTPSPRAPGRSGGRGGLSAAPFWPPDTPLAPAGRALMPLMASARALMIRSAIPSLARPSVGSRAPFRGASGEENRGGAAWTADLSRGRGALCLSSYHLARGAASTPSCSALLCSALPCSALLTRRQQERGTRPKGGQATGWEVESRWNAPMP